MEVNELKSQIQTKTFKPFYIMTGVEWKVQRIYIDQIVKVTDKELKYLDSITDIYGKRGNTSFVQKSYVYVIRDDKELLTNEKLQAQIESIAGQNIIVLLLTSVDKRTKFYKSYKDLIIEFEPLKPVVLAKYINKQIPLSDANVNKLMEVCEYDYGRCLLEIDKIKQFVAGNRQDNRNLHESPSEMYTDYCFRVLLESGAIYQPPKDAIFDFVDAILDYNIKLAFDLYHQCLAVGEAVMVMLTVLYNNAKAVLQVQSCSSQDVSKSTGLTPFQVMNAKKHLNKYRNGDLVHLMKCCQHCQNGIVTGTMEEEFVIEYILTDLWW